MSKKRNSPEGPTISPSFELYLRNVLQLIADKNGVTVDAQLKESLADSVLLTILQENYNEASLKLPFYKSIRVSLEEHVPEAKKNIMSRFSGCACVTAKKDLQEVADNLKLWLDNRNNRAPSESFGKDLVAQLDHLIQKYFSEEANEKFHGPVKPVLISFNGSENTGVFKRPRGDLGVARPQNISVPRAAS